jgi:hypothetical protein
VSWSSAARELQGSHAMEDGEGAPAAVRERENGVGEKKRAGGLPFIEPSSGHGRLHQQVAGVTVPALGGSFRPFLFGIGSRLLHKISSLMYTLQILYST